VFEPNDIDCVLLIPEGSNPDRRIIDEILKGLPFLDVEIVNQEGWEEFVEVIFSTDRYGVAKGIVEVEL
jgi:hypothetical protein